MAQTGDDFMKYATLVPLVIMLASVDSGCERTPDQPPSAFRFPDGVRVRNAEGLREAYSIRQTDEGFAQLTVNISADRLQDTILELSRLVQVPAFAVVEISTNRGIEQTLRKSDRDPFHKDVYFLDGIEYETFQNLFLKYSRFFVHDGAITFGFGSHRGHDEVFVGRYKLVEIYAQDPDKYVRRLDELGYPRREPLRTVWDTFTSQSPGETRTIEVEGKTVFDLVEELKAQGFYLAERRAE